MDRYIIQIYLLFKYLLVDLFPMMPHGKSYDILPTVLVKREKYKSGVNLDWRGMFF
jgi:hypothetical protein